MINQQEGNFEGYDTYLLWSQTADLVKAVNQNPQKYLQDILTLEETAKQLNQVIERLK